MSNQNHPWRQARIDRIRIRPEIRVACPECGIDYDERDVRVLDIEENIMGQDVLHFRCPEGHVTHALRRG